MYNFDPYNVLLSIATNIPGFVLYFNRQAAGRYKPVYRPDFGQPWYIWYLTVFLLTVHGHLIDLCGVVLLNITQDTDVVILHKVDGHTFPAVTTRSTNPDEENNIVHIQTKTRLTADFRDIQSNRSESVILVSMIYYNSLNSFIFPILIN